MTKLGDSVYALKALEQYLSRMELHKLQRGANVAFERTIFSVFCQVETGLQQQPGKSQVWWTMNFHFQGSQLSGELGKWMQMVK